ncbi:MAG: retropepsin-like aspartic protease [Planctomycetota bacterium]|jgi:predicted aspartyl protease
MNLDKYFTSLKVGLFLSFLVLFLSGGCADEPERASDRPADQKVLAEFKISKDGYPILLPITFKDKEYLFLLDTGSSYTAFDTSLKHELGEVTKVEKGLTAGSRIVAEFYDAPEVFLGLINLQDCGEVACLDLKMVSLVLGKQISGLLGMNFLKKYIVQIDYDNGTLLFLQPRQKRHSGWGNELSISYNSLGIPTITGNIYDSIKVDFRIDTGANSTGGLSNYSQQPLV